MFEAKDNIQLPRIKPEWETTSAYFDFENTNQHETKLNLPVWRLIPMFQAPGAIQMALDGWLLQQQYSGNHPPTLRFYTWSPCAISLGYHQYRWPEFWQQLTWEGRPVELVRRPTGGRAVLHQGDLTYAVVTADLPGNRLQVYQKLCCFLIRGWQQLGVDLRYGKTGRDYHHQPNCFGTATGADLVLANGTKFIGSAQLQRGRAVLQHGSIRLNPDLALFNRVFGEQFAQPIQLPFDGQGEDLIRRIIPVLVAAASRCFDIRFNLQPLSAMEWKSILEFISSQRERLRVAAGQMDSGLFV